VSEAFHPRRGRFAAYAWVPAALGLAAAAAVMAFPSTFTIARPTAKQGEFDRTRTSGLESKANAAARTLREAETLIRSAKAKAAVTAEADGDRSGLIGGELTPLVTTLGNLEAKRTAANPLWAAVLTRRLAAEGIGPGDVIAAGFSGSFPGLNLAVMAAARALGAEVVAVSSVTASTWGANQPGFTWPEIECRVVRSGLLPPASVAITTGGDDDNARELEPGARALAERIRDDAAACLGARALHPSDLRDGVRQRLSIYRRAASGRPIALYVNVGGASASLGRSSAVLRLRSGFAPPVPFDRSEDRGVMARLAEQHVRILTLLNIKDLAVRWGIPLGGPPP
jgi:poly-gamma-glutamate system protein